MNTLHRLRHDDRGTTLVELLVGMAIMVIFMGMFTSAMLLMSKTVDKVEAVSTTTTQLSNAFTTLDREVRYATGISSAQPYGSVSDPGWHVEFSSIKIDRTTDTSTATEVDLCTQLRTYQGQLWQRTWRVDLNNAAVQGSGTAWKPLASGLSASSVAYNASPGPFATSAATTNGSTNTGLQQLTVSLTMASTTAGSATSANTITFTALNAKTVTGAQIDTSTICPQIAPGAASP